VNLPPQIVSSILDRSYDNLSDEQRTEVDSVLDFVILQYLHAHLPLETDIMSVLSDMASRWGSIQSARVKHLMVKSLGKHVNRAYVEMPDGKILNDFRDVCPDLKFVELPIAMKGGVDLW